MYVFGPAVPQELKFRLCHTEPVEPPVDTAASLDSSHAVWSRDCQCQEGPLHMCTDVCICMYISLYVYVNMSLFAMRVYIYTYICIYLSTRHVCVGRVCFSLP